MYRKKANFPLHTQIIECKRELAFNANKLQFHRCRSYF